MNTVWILVCDSAHASIYETRAGDPVWKVVKTLHHAASQMKTSELVTDGAGRRSSQGATSHHNALAPSSIPKEVEKGHFAREIGGVLDEAMRSRRFARWVLVAPPHFLGIVTKELTPALEKHLLSSVDKDLTYLDVSELKERLGDAVRIPADQREPVREPRRVGH